MIGLEDISVGSPGEKQSTGEGGEGKRGSFLMDGFKEGDFMLNKEEVEKDGSCCEVEEEGGSKTVEVVVVEDFLSNK